MTVCPSTATIFEGGEAIKLGGNMLAACSWSPFIIKLALLLNLYEFKPEALHLKESDDFKLEKIVTFFCTCRNPDLILELRRFRGHPTAVLSF